MRSLLLLALLTSAAFAAPKTPTTGPELSPTTAGDWQRHPHDDKYYTESWTAIVRATDGHVLYLNFLYTNIGVVSGRSGVNLALTPPGGKGRSFKWEYETGDFSQSGGTLKIKGNTFSLNGKDARLQINEGNVKLDLQFKGWTNGVKYHSGRIWLDNDEEDFVDTYFHIPRADVTGTLTVNGKSSAITGDGYVDHWVQNVLAGQYATRWHNARFFGKDLTMIALTWNYDEDHGGKTGARVLVADRQRVHFITDKVNLRVKATEKDPDGYRYGTQIEVNVPVKPAIRSIFEAKRTHERSAVLEEMSFAERQVAKVVAGNPIIYRMEAAGFVNLVPEGAQPIHHEGAALTETIVLSD